MPTRVSAILQSQRRHSQRSQSIKERVNGLVLVGPRLTLNCWGDTRAPERIATGLGGPAECQAESRLHRPRDNMKRVLRGPQRKSSPASAARSPFSAGQRWTKRVKTTNDRQVTSKNLCALTDSCVHPPASAHCSLYSAFLHRTAHMLKRRLSFALEGSLLIVWVPLREHQTPGGWDFCLIHSFNTCSIAPGKCECMVSSKFVNSSPRWSQ